MDVFEAMRTRHSVRKYLEKSIPADVLAKLRQEVDACNREGNLHIRLVADEPGAFDCAMAKYGSFSNVRNYFVLVGPDDDGLEERAGYYGERLVILAQTLGLNTCWVGLTFSKKKARMDIGPGEKLALVIALGYGATRARLTRISPWRGCAGQRVPCRTGSAGGWSTPCWRPRPSTSRSSASLWSRMARSGPRPRKGPFPRWTWAS